MSGQLIGRGYITIAGLKDGDPAKTYVLIPSVDSITKKLDGTLSVTGVTCSVYKVTGSSAYALTSDHTLSYVRTPDGAGGILIHAAGTSGSIAVLATTESIEFELKDGSKVIDRVRVPVLSDATDVNNELDTYNYLKEALAKQGTAADRGLLLTSLIALGYTDSNNVRHTLAGTNGIYVPKLGGRTIGSWWGGDMLDRFKADDTRKTYDELKTESGKNNPLAATSLVRMDGSAYFANGNIGFKADGSGWLGNENGIKWTPLGALTIGAGVTIDVTGDDGVKRTLTDVANFITAVTSLLAPADANGKELQWNQVAQAQTIMAKKTFFSLGGVSAKGIGSSSGGGGSVFGLYTDSTWAAMPSTTDALGAVLGKSLHTRISALEGKNYLDELTLAEAGTGNAVTDVSLSNDKKTLTVTYGASYLSGITKAMVEGVLTGNITTHTHSQYLTSASLSGYYSKTQADERFQPKGNYVTDVTLNDYYTKPQIYNSPIIVYISRFVTLDFDEPLLPQSLGGTPTVLYDTVSKTLVAMSGYPIRPSITNSDGIFTNWVGAEGMGSVLTATRGWTPRSDVLYYNLQASEFYRWDGSDMVAVDELNDMASGGGLDESQLADYLTTNNYAKKSDIPSLSGYATQAWVTGKGYLTSSSLHTLTIQKNGTTVGTYKPNADATINIADVASAATLENHLNNTTNHVAGAEKLLWNQTATKLNAILGEDSDTIINKWEEVVAFLDTYTEADTLANLLSNKVDKEHGKGLSSNDFTDALKLKLTGLQNYTLPTASADTLGGVKIGANITITNGVISTHAPYSLPTASASVKGGVKVGVFGGLKMSGETLVVNLSATDIPDLSWEKITSGKPTTLAGYGITDAKIENGVITLGGKTITPITSHQSIHALTIKGNGTSLLTYNPKTEAAEIDITATKIGASPSSHIHTQYAPVTALTNIYTKTEADNKFQPKGSYLTAITKAQVEAVLTGNITSHTHAQYAPVLLLANYVERVKLDNNTDIAALTGSHLYYSDTDGNTATMKNTPFAGSFMMLTQTCYNSGDDIRRARLAVDAWGGIKVFDDRGVSGTGGTWHTVLTDKNTKITNGTITINGTSITPLVQHQSLANYVTTNTAQNITGRKTISGASLKLIGSTTHNTANRHTAGLLAFQESGYDDQFGIWGSFGGTGTAQKLFIGGSGNGTALANDQAGTTFTPYLTIEHTTGNLTVLGKIIKSGGTSSQFLMADGSVATKHTLSSVTNLGWGGTSGQIATINTIAYWNGQYGSGASNLQYCDRGRFGTMATMDAADYPTVERFNSGVAFMAGKFPDGGVQFNVMHDEDEPGVGNIVNIPTKTSHLTNDSGFLTSHQSLANRLWAQGSTDFDPATMDGYYVGMTTKSGITTNWWHLLSMNWGTGNTINNKTWASQLALPTEGRNGVYYRSASSSSAYSSWVKLLDANNYSSILDGRYYTEAEADARFVTALEAQGDTFVWKRGGTNHAITPYFATQTSVLRSQGRLTAVTNTKHGAGLRVYEVYNNGYPTACGNLIAVQGGTASGQGELLLGWSGSDSGHANIYYRNQRDNSAAFSAWATILDSVNYSTTLDSRYLKKAGDMMTGELTIKTSAFGGQLNIFRNDTGGNSVIKYTNAEKLLGYIGIGGSGGVFPYEPMFSGENGTWYKILHSGNYAATLDPRYVNVSGDTMTGCLTLTSGSSAAYNKTALSFIKTGTTTEQARIGTDASAGLGMYATGSIYLRPNVTLGVGSTNGLILSSSAITYNNNTVWHAGNDGAGSGLDADLWDGEQLGNFRMRKVYTLNLSSLSTSNFYPVTFGKSAWEMDCEIHSPSRGGAEAYNQNHIHFILTALGWSDTPARLLILSQGNFDSNEITIGAVGTGNQNGERCVWLRGGMNYTVIANAVPTLRTADYSDGNEKYTVGTNLYGGTNANVTIRWQNTDALRDSAKAATLQSNVASATKLQTARKIFGVNFDGTGDVNGTVHAAAVEISHPTPFIDFHFGSSTADYTSRIIETASGRLSIEGKLSIGYVNDSYKLATSSFICNSWIRTVGSAGWYSETYGGGWCMTDSTWIRIHGGKSLYAASGIIRTDGELQVGGGGDKFRVTAAGAVTATSFTKRGGTAAQALMADGSVRRVITFDDLADDGGISVSDFDAALANGLVSVSALTEWDGRVHWTKANQSSQTGTTEIYNCNLQYCALGKFGDVVTHNASEFLTSASLSGYATQTWVNSQGFMKSHTHQVIMPTGETSGITLASFNKDGVRVYQQTNDKGDGISYCAILSVSAGSEHRYFQIIGGKGGTNLRWRTTNSDGTALGAVKTLLDSTNTYLSNGTITINGASIKPLISHQSLANYVTLNTAQEISGAKTFTASMTARAITPQTSGTYNLGSTTSHWNHIFCRRLYVTTGGSDSLTAAGLGTAVGLGWLELRSAGTPYIDFTGSNSTADYNVRLAYQNSQLEVNGANFSVANTIRSKAYIGMIFDYIGSTAKANTYGVMFYKRDTYFNIIRTKKGAPDTPTSDHGGSLMEINLATNAVTFAGVVTASNISTSSDARLKTRIADIAIPIAEIAAAPLWRYRREDTGVVDVGSTAQYWGAILPELTRTDEQGWMSLDYGKTALLASVSLARKADDHEARIKALEAENRALKQEIERIKAA